MSATLGLLRRAVHAAVGLLACADLAAAGTPKARRGMELPPELAGGATEWKIEEHRRVFLPNRPVPKLMTIGPFEAVNYRLGWEKDRGTHLQMIGDVDRPNTRQEFSFDLLASGASWRSACAVLGASSRVGLDTPDGGEVVVQGDRRARLVCEFVPPEGEEPWTLEFTAKSDAKFGMILDTEASGRLYGGSSALELEGSNRQTRWGKAGPHLTGSLMRRDGRPVAAVDFINTALLATAELPAELQPPAAAAAVALLVFNDSLERQARP